MRSEAAFGGGAGRGRASSMPSPTLPTGATANAVDHTVNDSGLWRVSMRSTTQESSYQALHAMYGRMCPGPMWANNDFVCEEVEEIPDRYKWIDIHGNNRVFFDQGVKCTVRCPRYRFWQFPDVWSLECRDGRWESTGNWQESYVGRKAEGIKCSTALWAWIVACALSAGLLVAMVACYHYCRAHDKRNPPNLQAGLPGGRQRDAIGSNEFGGGFASGDFGDAGGRLSQAGSAISAEESI